MFIHLISIISFIVISETLHLKTYNIKEYKASVWCMCEIPSVSIYTELSHHHSHKSLYASLLNNTVSILDFCYITIKLFIH